MTDRFAEATGTSPVGGTERHAPRSALTLIVPVVAIAAVLSLVPLWLGDSRVNMTVAILGLAFISYTIGFNLIFGSTGQLFLSVGALAGIGGYGAAIFADTVGLPILVSVLLATLAASIMGGFLSWIAVRRSLGVIFTGIVTLIFALAFHNLLLGLGRTTGGESGFLIQAGRDSFLRSRVPAYYVMLGLALVFLFVHGMLRRSHIGWAFRALRDDEVAAELAGVNVARYRVYAALIGAAILGMTGAIYGLSQGRVSPTTYGFAEVDVVVVVMLAFGGIGSLFGPVLGGITFTIINELLDPVGHLRLVPYGALIIVLFLWIPRGVIPTVGDWLRRRRGSANLR
jgi:branched-chain amino acid transport system permease protein